MVPHQQRLFEQFVKCMVQPSARQLPTKDTGSRTRTMASQPIRPTSHPVEKTAKGSSSMARRERSRPAVKEVRYLTIRARS